MVTPFNFIKKHIGKSIFFVSIGVLRLLISLLLALSATSFFDITWQTASNRSFLLQQFGIIMPTELTPFLVLFCLLIIARVLTTIWYKSGLVKIAAQYGKILEVQNGARRLSNLKKNNLQKQLEKGFLGFTVDILFTLITLSMLFLIDKTLAICTIFLMLILVVSITFLYKIVSGVKYLDLKTSKIDKQSNRVNYLFVKHSYNALKDVFLYLTLLGVFCCYYFKLLDVNRLLPSSAFLYILMLILAVPSIKNILNAQRIWYETRQIVQKTKNLEKNSEY